MARTKGALLALLAALALASPAAAQVAGQPWEFSGQGGWMHYDTRQALKDGPAAGGTLGLRVQSWLTLEAQVLLAPSKSDSGVEFNENHTFAGADLRWNLRPAEGRVVPFVLTGIGYGASHGGPTLPDKLDRGVPSMGVGALFNLGNQRAYLRVQARDYMFRERGALEFSNHFAVTIGIQYVWRGKVRDSDLDGVRDWLDKCPGTPIGAAVDANGCPKDSDGDGVLDGLDKCPDTPKGCKVDKNGCPSDADGDGVCDGIDQCPDTPKGATVDAKGCPKDSDGDGVLDGLDKCPNTPKGCTVDANGCPADADGDGVCDGLDQCPNTPVGLKVDANGCPIEVSEKETQLLDTGMIRLQNINFDTGKASILPESFGVIDEVGKILQQYPQLRIEIGGHTDNKGKQELNETLSQARADSVLAYVKSKFPVINATQYTTRGYGPNRPIAPNTTELGRARNRRVEFKVLNADTLRIERERRHFIRKDERVPPPAPVAPDTTRH